MNKDIWAITDFDDNNDTQAKSSTPEASEANNNNNNNNESNGASNYRNGGSNYYFDEASEEWMPNPPTHKSPFVLVRCSSNRNQGLEKEVRAFAGEEFDLNGSNFNAVNGGGGGGGRKKKALDGIRFGVYMPKKCFDAVKGRLKRLETEGGATFEPFPTPYNVNLILTETAYINHYFHKTEYLKDILMNPRICFRAYNSITRELTDKEIDHLLNAKYFDDNLSASKSVFFKPGGFILLDILSFAVAYQRNPNEECNNPLPRLLSFIDEMQRDLDQIWKIFVRKKDYDKLDEMVHQSSRANPRDHERLTKFQNLVVDELNKNREKISLATHPPIINNEKPLHAMIHLLLFKVESARVIVFVTCDEKTLQSKFKWVYAISPRLGRDLSCVKQEMLAFLAGDKWNGPIGLPELNKFPPPTSPEAADATKTHQKPSSSSGSSNRDTVSHSHHHHHNRRHHHHHQHHHRGSSSSDGSTTPQSAHSNHSHHDFNSPTENSPRSATSTISTVPISTTTSERDHPVSGSQQELFMEEATTSAPAMTGPPSNRGADDKHAGDEEFTLIRDDDADAPLATTTTTIKSEQHVVMQLQQQQQQPILSAALTQEDATGIGEASSKKRKHDDASTTSASPTIPTTTSTTTDLVAQKRHRTETGTGTEQQQQQPQVPPPPPPPQLEMPQAVQRHREQEQQEQQQQQLRHSDDDTDNNKVKEEEDGSTVVGLSQESSMSGGATFYANEIIDLSQDDDFDLNTAPGDNQKILAWLQ